MNIKCVFCGKGLKCPMHNREVLFKSANIKKVEEFSSASPPTVFIGSKLRYPKVNIGLLSPPERTEENWLFDAQRYWASNEFNIPDILGLRGSLINSRTQTRVKELSGRLIESFQEVGMAVKPVDVDVKLESKVGGILKQDNITLPQGPYAKIKKVDVGNVSVPRHIDKVVSDSDLKSLEAMKYLYKRGYDEQRISQVLSVGVLGVKKARRLVPTRFSITATDDAIGRQLIKEIKDYKLINDCELHVGGYLGNYYFVLLFPDVVSYELFEAYLPSSEYGSGDLKVTTDFESLFGRTRYVSQTAGGYYAARLPILEYLHRSKKQASILALRFITEEYYAHLGVFVCREASRKDMKSKKSKV